MTKKYLTKREEMKYVERKSQSKGKINYKKK